MHKMCTHIHAYICHTNPCLKCKILMKLHPGKLTAGPQKPPQNLLPSTSMTVPAVNFPGQKHGDYIYPGSQITNFIPCRVSTKKERPYFLHGGWLPRYIPSLKLANCTWKWMVGRWFISLWGWAYFRVRTVSFRECICLKFKRRQRQHLPRRSWENLWVGSLATCWNGCLGSNQRCNTIIW